MWRVNDTDVYDQRAASMVFDAFFDKFILRTFRIQSAEQSDDLVHIFFFSVAADVR
jgi:hypothetical protein